ncbi:MAG: DUF167 domain-containing protein [Rhodospirillales bacterium]|nr:DUF167 domain-containing protein [Rhodospirillales bacterium]
MADGLRVPVRLTPKASRERIDGIVAEADGTLVLKAAVTAVPEDGKANAALVKLLAKAWRMPKSAITIVAGATDRRKVLHLSGDPDDLRRRLDEWMKTS